AATSAVRTVVHQYVHVLFFSRDGHDWTVQDISPLVNADADVRLVVGDDRILLLAEEPNVTSVRVGIPPETD
ncbi:MAG TPA: hypothetical protein VK070_07210, partial [Acidimicrobiia bacterium]|nr:hypothetical protein [Acidimicrobiia bacterium]